MYLIKIDEEHNPYQALWQVREQVNKKNLSPEAERKGLETAEEMGESLLSVLLPWPLPSAPPPKATSEGSRRPSISQPVPPLALCLRAGLLFGFGHREGYTGMDDCGRNT